MHRLLTICCMLAAIYTTLGCDASSSERDAIGDVAQTWADSYFNFDYDKAQTLTDTDSHKWLSLAASNITEDDITVIRAQQTGASVNVRSVEMKGENEATVGIEVTDLLVADSIGKPMRPISSAIYNINMVRCGERWLVRMAGLPQSERQSRD